MTCMSKLLPSIEHLKLQIPFLEISLATNGFSKENFIGVGGYGPVYQGMSEKHGHIAVKRLLLREGQREEEADIQFKTEIVVHSKYKHKNIASLIGFCDENGERILVYKYESKRSLEKHLYKEDLTWTERIRICLDAARGLNYLHDHAGPLHGIIHRDIKSSNILLDENLNAKISDFGLSRLGPANTQSSFVFSNPCGTPGHIDPNYMYNGYLTEKCDVYSFGLMLCEVLCGRHAIIESYNDEHRSLTVLFRKHYSKGTLDKIIPSYLKKDMNKYSLLTFSKIVNECLKNEEERPTMQQVVEQLEKALQSQEALEIPLKDITSTCNNFEGKNSIGWDGGARVYEGISEKHGPIFIKRFPSGQGLGDHDLKTELPLLEKLEHKDRVYFLGFCKEDGENIHVYKCAIDPSLDQYVDNRFLSWTHRLQLMNCLDMPYLEFQMLHQALGTNDFCGLPRYNDYLPQKSDVYSVGVTLFEVLTGRLADKDNPQSLPKLVREHYKNKTLHSIIPPYLLKQINPDSLATYTDIAFQCLNDVDERPTMKQVQEQLQKALDQQLQSCSSSHQDRSTGLDLQATPTETGNQFMINLLEPTSLNLSEHIAK